MANIARALGTGAAATGFLTVIPVVFQIVSSVTSFAARTPLIDAAVALIPGLAAMSRVGNNAELLSLRSHMREPRNRYFAVRSNFEPEDPGWRFWQYFRRLPTRIADVGADMVFEGRNDLVVDTGSMTNFEDGLQFDPDRLYDFRTSATVHHTNYFRQREALDFIAKALQTVSRG